MSDVDERGDRARGAPPTPRHDAGERLRAVIAERDAARRQLEETQRECDDDIRLLGTALADTRVALAVARDQLARAERDAIRGATARIDAAAAASRSHAEAVAREAAERAASAEAEVEALRERLIIESQRRATQPEQLRAERDDARATAATLADELERYRALAGRLDAAADALQTRLAQAGSAGSGPSGAASGAARRRRPAPATGELAERVAAASGGGAVGPQEADEPIDELSRRFDHICAQLAERGVRAARTPLGRRPGGPR